MQQFLHLLSMEIIPNHISEQPKSEKHFQMFQSKHVVNYIFSLILYVRLFLCTRFCYGFYERKKNVILITSEMRFRISVALFHIE